MKTPLERVLLGETPEKVAEVQAFLDSEIPVIRDLCHQFPPGLRVNLGKEIYWVVGYAELVRHDHAHLIVSPINPREDPILSRIVTRIICPNRLVVYHQEQLN